MFEVIRQKCIIHHLGVSVQTSNLLHQICTSLAVPSLNYNAILLSILVDLLCSTSSVLWAENTINCTCFIVLDNYNMTRVHAKCMEISVRKTIKSMSVYLSVQNRSIKDSISIRDVGVHGLPLFVILYLLSCNSIIDFYIISEANKPDVLWSSSSSFLVNFAFQQ